MLHHEQGVLSGSEVYDNLPSKRSLDLFLYILSCGCFYCAPDYQVHRKQFKSVLLCYIKSGRLSFGYPGQHFYAVPGQIALIDCYTEHYYRVDQITEFLWFHFDGFFARELVQKLIEQASPTITVPKSIYEKLYNLFSLYKNSQPCPEFQVSCILYDILCQIAASSDVPSNAGTKDPISNAVDYMNSHFKTIKNIEEVCAAVGLSKFYFIHSFKKQMNISPYEYLIQQRISFSRHLLKTTRLSIKEIAFQCGYESEPGFVKAFLNKTGITPTEYRNMPL